MKIEMSYHQSRSIHVLQILGAPSGGIRRHVHDLIFGFSSDIKSSYVYAENRTDKGFERDRDKLLEKTQSMWSLHIDRVPSWRDLTNILRIIRWVRRERVDIVHGHGAKGGLYARIVTAMTGIASCYTPHGGSVHPMHGFIGSHVYRFMERAVQRWTTCFVFESKYTKQTFAERITLNRPWLINLNGIQVDDVILDAAPEVEGELYNIGYFGILRHVKGPDILINAMMKVCERLPEAHLHMFGDGPKYDQLKRMIFELGLVEKVTLHGEITEIESAMTLMDLVVIPSRFESFGYVAVEARQLKVWVVASNVGGLKEIVEPGQTGDLVEPECAEFSEAIINARKSVPVIHDEGRFSLDRMISRLRVLYMKINRG